MAAIGGFIELVIVAMALIAGAYYACLWAVLLGVAFVKGAFRGDE